MARGRRTYVSRETPGRNGKYLHTQKILLRYDNRRNIKRGIENINIIDKIVKEAYQVAYDIAEVDMWVLEKAKDYYLKALKKYTPVDTGELRDSWETYLDEYGVLHWRNSAGGEGNEYVFAQNYGKDGVTPTGGEYYYPGYHFLEKAGVDTINYIEELRHKQLNKVVAKAKSRGAI